MNAVAHACQAIVRSAFATIDTMDAERVASFMTEDCVFAFANMAPVVGRKAITATLADFFAQIAGIHHDVLDVAVDGDRIATQVRVVYTRKDGSQLSCPAATHWRMRANEIRDYRIYVDASNLFKETR